MTTITSKPHALTWIIGGSALILFGCSSLRHTLFQSSAFDLGYFDQAIYLISQGQTPIVSFWGYHFLGGHADWVIYGLALFYKIYPSVGWLFAIQAIALALGVLPIFHLACHAGLKESQAIGMAVVYLLYPLIFNLNLFDFHPEVMALPAFFAAILMARKGKVGWFCVAIVFILGCRDALSLTVAAMGFWLLFFDKKTLPKKQNTIAFLAIFAGVAWFLIATQVVIPSFRPGGVESVGRYAFLGNSLGEIAKNLILQPGIVLGRIFTLSNLEYLCLLLAPIIWGLSLQHLTPLVGAIPTLAINLITDYQPQKDLIHQYSLPALPFLLLAVISTLAAGKGWLQNRRGIILWALVAFLALAKFGYFGSKYLASLDTRQAMQQAIAQINTKGSVLVPAQVAPHVTHRPVVSLVVKGSESTDLAQFEYVLLNLRHPGWESNQQVVSSLLSRIKSTPIFKLIYQRDDVYLFRKKTI
jgi:uncharacterized membrane protein